MIDLYTFGTGNGKRASVILEECGLPYTVHKVDLGKGEQKAADFLKLNPLGVIPVIVDPDGPGGKKVTISQSGAIAVYCAQKSGKYLPSDPVKRLKVMEWLMHAISDGAQTVGTVFQSSRLPEKPVKVIEYFNNRLMGFFKAIDGHLAGNEYLAGELSVADFALYTVVASGKTLVSTEGLKNLERWFAALSARPGVQKGMKVPA
jgi:GST-like protein